MKFEIEFARYWEIAPDDQWERDRRERENEAFISLLQEGWEILTSWADGQYMYRANFILRRPK